MAKRKRGQRGCASCSKKHDEDVNIEYDENNKPLGKAGSKLMSWFGSQCRYDFPYYIETSKFEDKQWEELWLLTKETWNIKSDAPKNYFLKKAKRHCTNFRSKLVTKYVRKEAEPFGDYPFLDATMWKEFCKVKSTEESLAKSNKAKESAKANKNVARLGRTGYAGLREKANTLWQLLVAKYPDYLKNIRDERTKSYIMARAKKIKGTDSYELPSDAHETINEMACTEKKMIEDGTYFEGKDDPLIRVLGPEHGGRTRTISNVIGSTKVRGGLFKGSRKLIRSEAGLFANHERFSVPRVDASPSFPGSSSYASGDLSIDYSSIEELKRCDLLFPYDVSLNMTVAKGKVWPSSETLLHTSQLNKDYVKVQVDCVCEGCDKMPILPDSRTTNIEKVGDMLHEFVMWPRFALKLVSKEAPRKSMNTSGKTPSSSSSHGRVSPQINTSDLAMSSVYKPQFIEADPCNDNLQPSFTNMLTTMQQVMPTTHAPDPYPDCFIDPEVDDSWKRIKMMSLEIQELAETLKTFMGERHYIESSSPAGMYRETIVMAIPYVEILQLFCNDWLDFSIVHWFAMDFYKSGMNSKCAFFNPEHINGEECITNPLNAQQHIIDIFLHHRDKQFFLAPYVARNHWSLFIVCPLKRQGYIVDSMNRGKHKGSYKLSSTIDNAFGLSFDWQMVKCQQQKQYWECGFMVIKHMQEFVNFYQHTFPETIWNQNDLVSTEEIRELVLDTVQQFLSKMFS